MKRKPLIAFLLIAAVVILVSLATILFVSENSNEYLLFSFMLVRHGARTPMYTTQGFDQPKEMLTPMGMR